MGKRKTVWLLVFALAFTLYGLHPERAGAASVTITNGTDWLDTAGNPIHANSGNILQVGPTYYLYGEHAVGDKFDSVNVYTSTDLKNWTFSNAILTKDSATELASSKIERPKVIYNASTGQYVLWAHYENGTDYNLGRVAVATSSTPNGKFTYEGSFRPLDYESRDMTVFVDTDGTGYLVTASRKNGGANDTMAIFKMNASYTGIQSFEGWLFENAYREAPAVVKKGNRYYLFTSQAAGWYPNQGAYATATSMTGPWTALTPYGNPSAFGTQIHDIATIQGSSTTSYIYMADRWNPMNLGEHKHIWLPLTLNDANGTASLEWYTSWNIDAATGQITLPALVNHAQGKAATASSTASGSSPSLVNDGNYQTSWVASSNSWPAWWQVDFGAPKTITEVDISWFMYKGSEGYYKYKIEISNDGVNYATLDRTNNLTYGFTTDAVHFTARYVRINMVNAVLWNNPGNWYTPTLHEVKMLGPSNPEATSYSQFVSHNVPDRMIRHANYVARIDANVSPALDAQFRVVPGLASSSGISLESINYPGYFLKRNTSNKIVLEAFANTTAYKGDATFLISPGWADSSKVSLQSFSQPGYYIRHYDYVLQLDAINASSSSTVKSDATFGRTNF
ncbi:AbfB domain-containing protein [Paenibacillus silvae]|uniref:AbfB domain-containing protein n=1 Tax=Paenibacillus silvae TaxID=1325358 RepID=UPI002003A0B1|nr:AbfB domain-containing protein [Paenibacillus silvae]MCK6076764.1 AbfB domain-containing protein [Paenibacillus silvae]MCK6151190.1 AbfB domain-containing protein [Paenibacillus silvae]MCK6269450.1 AbfB domain-containing protein [Paenibacillus silvae]